MTGRRPIRWGILGTGAAARLFADGLRELPDATLAAIASRTRENADAFGARSGAVRAYLGYEALVQDGDIDVVYVATPNHRHRDDALLCLAAGRPVLCEKPLALNASQGREIAAAARRTGLFCMEAMWTRFLPASRRAREIVNSGVLGDVRVIAASLGSPASPAFRTRKDDPAAGGGALLDLGVYPLSWIHGLFGAPTSVEGRAAISDRGIDEDAVAILRYEPAPLATVTVSLTASLPGEMVISGSRGQLRVHAPLYRPSVVSVRSCTAASGAESSRGAKRNLLRLPALRRLAFDMYDRFAPLLDPDQSRYVEPFAGNGYHYEAAEVAACLRAGRTESALMPLDESIAVLTTIDRLRQSWLAPSGAARADCSRASEG